MSTSPTIQMRIGLIIGLDGKIGYGVVPELLKTAKVQFYESDGTTVQHLEFIDLNTNSDGKVVEIGEFFDRKFSFTGSEVGAFDITLYQEDGRTSTFNWSRNPQNIQFSPNSSWGDMTAPFFLVAHTNAANSNHIPIAMYW